MNDEWTCSEQDGWWQQMDLEAEQQQEEDDFLRKFGEQMRFDEAYDAACEMQAEMEATR